MPQPITLIRQGASELLEAVELVLQRFDPLVRGLPPISHKVSDRSIQYLLARRTKLKDSARRTGLSVSDVKDDTRVRVPSKGLAQQLSNRRIQRIAG